MVGRKGKVSLKRLPIRYLVAVICGVGVNTPERGYTVGEESSGGAVGQSALSSDPLQERIVSWGAGRSVVHCMLPCTIFPVTRVPRAIEHCRRHDVEFTVSAWSRLLTRER